jgi:aspartate aminotransferase
LSLTVSDRMQRVQPSATGAALALAAELRAAGRDVIGLGAGEPDFDTPQAIKDAAVAAIADGATKYTPVAGLPELKAAIQDKFRRENRLEFTAKQILVSSGAKQSLFNLCMALLDDNDEAIIPAPYWVSYPDMVRLSGAKPIIVPTAIEQDFLLRPEQLLAALNGQSRLLFLNSPCNPTGACYAETQLQELADVLREFPEVVVVSDEIYEHIHWAPERFVSFAAACPALADRVVTVNGVSKAYAMTGWRIGYAAGPEPLISAMTTIQGQVTSSACSVSQKAAEAALGGDQAVVATMAEAYRKRHDFVVAALNELPGFECRAGEGTFYAFPRVTAAMRTLKIAKDVDFVEFVLNEADVLLVPGSAFGAPGHVRLSFACSMETLEEAMIRLKRAVTA